MADLDALLSSEEPEEKKKEKNFGLDELHISKFAYTKAFSYAKLVLDFSRSRNVEIGGFLTQNKDAEDRIATDAFLTREQEVHQGEYLLKAEHVLKAGKELEEQGKKIIGWWHSHGRFKTFHSETDDTNQMVLLNEISPSNYISIPKEKKIDNLYSELQGDKIVFWDPENPGTKYQLGINKFKSNPDLELTGLNTLKEQRIGFAYSLVVNHHRWLKFRKAYSEIATRDLCSSCLSSNDVSIPVNQKMFDMGEFKINEDDLKDEIKEKVNIERPRNHKKYFYPSVYEEKKSNGTLTAPNLGTDIYKPIGRSSYIKKDGSKEQGNLFDRKW